MEFLNSPPGLSLTPPPEITENDDKYKSNCNNTLEGYQYDDLDCDGCKIDCNIDKEIKKKYELGRGGFNIVYSIENDHEKVLRTQMDLSRKYDEEKLSDLINREQRGLKYQAILSKNQDKGGYGCTNIAQVYDFGIYNNTVYAIIEKMDNDLFDVFFENEASMNNFRNFFSESNIKRIVKDCLIALDLCIKIIYIIWI